MRSLNREPFPPQRFKLWPFISTTAGHGEYEGSIGAPSAAVAMSVELPQAELRQESVEQAVGFVKIRNNYCTVPYHSLSFYETSTCRNPVVVGRYAREGGNWRP